MVRGSLIRKRFRAMKSFLMNKLTLKEFSLRLRAVCLDLYLLNVVTRTNTVKDVYFIIDGNTKTVYMDKSDGNIFKQLCNYVGTYFDFRTSFHSFLFSIKPILVNFVVEERKMCKANSNIFILPYSPQHSQ